MLWLETMAEAAIISKAVVLLLLIHYFVPYIACGGSVLVFVLLCTTMWPFKFFNHFDEKERVGCFALIVFLTWVGLQCVIVAFSGHTYLLFGPIDF